jgi:CDP-glucose 4,6-dehydratase
MLDGQQAATFDPARLAAAVRGRTVLLTGHSGFKGTWLALWLREMGARVVGISLPPATSPSMHDVVGLDGLIDGRFGDIREEADFARAAEGVDADLLIHMAANAIVRQCHDFPVDAYRTNVVGTAVVLQAARSMPSLKGIVVVTSDKCYQNNEWPWGYRETDALGGKDPYSSSKAGTELVASAFRQSYFNADGQPLLATVRAGNVFGGGDWAADRLIPDIVRATLGGAPTLIRNPNSTRPWQHVLEPLAGYLMVAEALLAGRGEAATAWNFGPDADSTVDVATMAGLLAEVWGEGGPTFRFGPGGDPREAGFLALDSARARLGLGWRPRLQLRESLGMTVDWYRRWAAGGTDMRDFTVQQIRQFTGSGMAGSAASGVSDGGLQRCG